MNKFLDIPFLDPESDQVINAVRYTLAFTLFVWILFGPFSTFYPEEKSFLYKPTGMAVLFPSLGQNSFEAIKAAILIGSAGMMFRRTCVVATRVTAVTFWILTAFVASFGSSWNYNTHLNIFLIALSFAPGDTQITLPKAQQANSAALFFMRVEVAVIYFQSALSKSLHGGFAWSQHTPYIHMVLQNGCVSFWLKNYPEVVSGFGALTIVLEFLISILFLIKRAQRLAAALAIFLHLAFFLALGITFWHLWIFFPALFLYRPGIVKANTSV